MITGQKSSMNLLLALVRRDIKARYRRSMLGPAWAILQPLILMVLFNMIRGFVNIPSDGVPYIIFSYSALVPWTFFSNAISMSGSSILSNASILKKMALPREIFPFAAVVTALFDFVMASIILVGMMIWYSVPITWSLAWLPLLTLLTLIFAFSIGMFIAALGTFKRDLIFATPFLMQVLLFASPIMYPLSSVPAKYRLIYSLNPIVGIIEGFRNALIHGTSPLTESLLFSALIIVITLLLSWSLFHWCAQYFSDVM